MKTLLDLIDDYQRALADVTDAPSSSLTAEALRMSRQALLDAVAHNFGFRQVPEWARERMCYFNHLGLVRDAQVCAAQELLGQSDAPRHDPLTWPLPCDVTVGHVTVKRGEPLQKLVDRAQALDKQVFRLVFEIAAALDKPARLDEIEQYWQQMAGISTAALGYWKEGDEIHPDYDTPALRQVAKLYADYVKARQEPPPFERPGLPGDPAPTEDLPAPVKVEVVNPTPENEAERLRGLLRVLAQRARSFPNFPMGYHLPEVFAAVGEDPPTPPTSSPPPCCCAENASRGMFVVRLKNMQQHGSPWLTVTSVLALLSDCDMLAQRGTL